ncbi:MAG: type 1 glutamine amidotransferase [Actinomycetes bacterium]
MAEILAIIHPDGGTSGVLVDGARDNSMTIEEWCPALSAEPPSPLESYSGLLVLGGDENIDEVDRYPYLEKEFEIVNDWIEQERPLFGVCLGAQMIAHLRGGSVFKASEKELGWIEFEQLPEALDDPIASFGDQTLTGLLWHSYACEPPPDATVLARNDLCVQAFRLGEAWAFQHHPEVDQQILDEWLEPLHKGTSQEQKDAALIDGGLADHLPAWNEYGRELFRRFAKRCG